jgi:type I restriction enzyme S subunit
LNNLAERSDLQIALPESWSVCKLGDVVQVSKDKAEPSEVAGGTRYIGLEHIEKSTGTLSGYGSSGEVRSTKSRFSEGNLLYGKLRPYLNKVYVAEFNGICSTDILVLRTLGASFTKFLKYRLLSDDFVRYANANVSGVQHPRVNAKILSQFDVELPPLNEQRRIVEKIEELFTKLDAGVRSLEQARAQLKSYRRSVLKAAVEGELSREWREAHRDELEPASELLERILQERWEKFASKKYKEPTLDPVADKPSTPLSWETVPLESVSDVVDPQPSHRTPPAVNDGVPYVGIGDVNAVGTVNFDAARKVSAQVLMEHRQRYQLKAGDFIFGKIGTLGKPVLLVEPFDYTLSANVVLIQPVEKISARFLFRYMSSPAVETVLSTSNRSTSQPAFGIKRIRSLAVPLPSLEEQHYIVDEIERRLSVVDKLEATVEANLRQANALRQSILKWAFSGELVPQDPDDEPASVLLKRIREERQAKKQKPARGWRGKTGPTERVQAEQGGLF